MQTFQSSSKGKRYRRYWIKMEVINHPTLSYSQITTYLSCHKKWYWQYIEDLTPKKKSPALQIGDLTHRLLDAYYKNTLKPQDIANLMQFAQELYPDSPPEEIETCTIQSAQLLNAYLQKFQDDDLQVTSPEIWLEKDFGDFTLTCRLDAICETPDHKQWRMEHKTTTRLDSAYLRGQRRGLQTGIAHWLAEELLPHQLHGTIYNILVKRNPPKCHRELVPNSKWLIDYAKQCVKGVVRSIKRRDFYPSLQCFTYNHTCEFEPLCRNDTPATRKAFYTSRKEVKERSQRVTF
jgi:hypothetical protein